ncbi:MAG: pyroglutamyl-peptidase I [Clostridia bacterium]|nr:pyroglutamyl-peptidase I [Clostridia bacterium]
MSRIEKLILSRDFDDESPHFYRNPWALRCELGLGEGDAWTKSARARAREIYHLLFPRPADAVLFDDVMIDYTFDSGEDVCLGPVSDAIRAESARLRRLFRYYRRWRHSVVKNLRPQTPQDFDVRSRVICYADGKPFGDEAIIDDEIGERGFGAGLVSYESECVLWVYDGRGCDAVFATPEAMLAFYDRLSPFFLQYDAAEMARRREAALDVCEGRREKRLLVTGFEPFGGETVNPAWEAVSRLPDVVGEYRLEKLRVPTVFGAAGEAALDAAARVRPEAVLCVGQAGGRAAVTPEMIAINLRSASIPDNAGNRPQDEPVVPGGPDGLFSTLPVRAMAARIRAAGLPALVSYSAGAFVCNDLMYATLHHFRNTGVRAGFIHVPYLPEQAKDGAPSMALGDIVRALTAAIEALDE